MPVTNDNTDLTPRTSFDGPALSFDFKGVRVGVAEYDEGPTGCTVIHFAHRALSAVDVRGGSPGVYMADAGNCHAICFAGGSLLGLEASAGVAAELFAMNGHQPGWENIPCVQGGILFDMPGPASVYPDKELGRAALRAAQSGKIPLGPRGAGRGAHAGKGLRYDLAEPAGQGAAFGQWGETKVLVLTVVNAIGAIVDRTGAVVRGHLDRESGRRRHLHEILGGGPAGASIADGAPRNTTLTAVITNQRLGPRDLQQVGRQVHASMARGIQPFHTANDGDVLFMVSTFEVTNEALPSMTIGALASELAWDAVLVSFDE
jgi:L-aminopeptidase/D-esterase-like protein